MTRMLLGLAALAGTCGAAGCDGDNCSSPETYQVYAPGIDASGIPACTANGDGGVVSFAVDGGGSGVTFPGASPLSSPAYAQCSVLCGSHAPPCCASVWVPNTFYCTPSCIP